MYSRINCLADVDIFSRILVSSCYDSMTGSFAAMNLRVRLLLLLLACLINHQDVVFRGFFRRCP